MRKRPAPKKSGHQSPLNAMRIIDGTWVVDPQTGERLLITTPRPRGLAFIDYADAKAVDNLKARGLSPNTPSKQIERGTPAWYAALIREEVGALRVALARGEQGEIVAAALHLGALLNEAETVARHGGTYLTGARVRGGLEKRRNARNDAVRQQANSRHNHWIASAQEIWLRHPHQTTSRCADLVIRALGLHESRKTVADVIRPHHPKKVGDAS
jgi:hypothetical protein